MLEDEAFLNYGTIHINKTYFWEMKHHSHQTCRVKRSEIKEVSKFLSDRHKSKLIFIYLLLNENPKHLMYNIQFLRNVHSSTVENLKIYAKYHPYQYQFSFCSCDVASYM